VLYLKAVTLPDSQSYGITISEKTLENLELIYAINTTISPDRAEQAGRIESARLLMISIVENPVDESMSGTLWLFPCAVCPHLLHYASH
jgi:hypothetical protein